MMWGIYSFLCMLYSHFYVQGSVKVIDPFLKFCHFLITEFKFFQYILYSSLFIKHVFYKYFLLVYNFSSHSLTLSSINFNSLCTKSFYSCLTHCDLMNYILPSSSIPGILRILEWVAMPASRGCFPDLGIKPLSINLITMDYDFDILHKKSLLEFIIKNIIIKGNKQKNLIFKKWKRSRCLPKEAYSWPTGNWKDAQTH